MPGICVAVKATTSVDGSFRKTTLKSWKSRPAAPMMTTRSRSIADLLVGFDAQTRHGRMHARPSAWAAATEPARVLRPCRTGQPTGPPHDQGSGPAAARHVAWGDRAHGALPRVAHRRSDAIDTSRTQTRPQDETSTAPERRPAPARRDADRQTPRSIRAALASAARGAHGVADGRARGGGAIRTDPRRRRLRRARRAPPLDRPRRLAVSLTAQLGASNVTPQPHAGGTGCCPSRI